MTYDQFVLWGVKEVSDAHQRACVANVAALIKNREEGECNWKASTIQEDYGPVLANNGFSHVGSISKALGYLQVATDRIATPRHANFRDAKKPGDYAIFFETHVVYGIIVTPSDVAVLDASMGQGWTSWAAFLAFAKTNQSLYGKDPAQGNQAYLLKPES